MVQRVAHRARLWVSCIEENEDEIRQVNDVVCDTERRVALGVGVEAWRIDENLASHLLATAGLELEICINTTSFASGNAFNRAAQVEERKAGIRIEREPR